MLKLSRISTSKLKIGKKMSSKNMSLATSCPKLFEANMAIKIPVLLAIRYATKVHISLIQVTPLRFGLIAVDLQKKAQLERELATIEAEFDNVSSQYEVAKAEEDEIGHKLNKLKTEHVFSHFFWLISRTRSETNETRSIKLINLSVKQKRNLRQRKARWKGKNTHLIPRKPTSLESRGNKKTSP
jgi:hypothetical protein